MVAQVKQAIANHPNATAAGTAGGGTLLLIEAAAQGGVHLSAFAAGAIITVAAWLRLYIGRRGIIGAAKEAWHALLHGSEGAS